MVAFTHFPHAVKQSQPGVGGHSINAWLGSVTAACTDDGATYGTTYGTTDSTTGGTTGGTTGDTTDSTTSGTTDSTTGDTTMEGFLHLDHSDGPRVYECTDDEMNIIVDGEMTISDSEGNVVEARVGDVLYFPKGSVITFHSNSRGVGFFCGQHRDGDE